MKTVELAEASASLSDYARRVRKETLLVTRKGKPLATLMAVGAHTDFENLTVTTDPCFMALIERSRRLYPAGTGLSSDELRQQLGIKRRTSKRKAR